MTDTRNIKIYEDTWGCCLDRLDALVLTSTADKFEFSNGAQSILLSNDDARNLVKLARRGLECGDVKK